MHNCIRCLDWVQEWLTDAEVTRQAIEGLCAICQVRLQRVDVWIIQRRHVNVENLMAVGEKLGDNMSACYLERLGQSVEL